MNWTQPCASEIVLRATLRSSSAFKQRLFQ